MMSRTTIVGLLRRSGLYPARTLRWMREIPLGLRLCNFAIQRVIGVNRNAPWPVHFTSTVVAPSRIHLGRDVPRSLALSGGCYLQGGNGIHVDDGTIWAPGVKLISANHALDAGRAWTESRPIRIGKHCWIGANAVILPGVTLGDHAIVGAGAVVTKSFEAGHCIVAGNPARIIRDLAAGNTHADRGATALPPDSAAGTS